MTDTALLAEIRAIHTYLEDWGYDESDSRVSAQYALERTMDRIAGLLAKADEPMSADAHTRIDAVAEAAQWEKHTIDGSVWTGEFAYGEPGWEPNLVRDWSVYTTRVGESSDTNRLGATGDPLVEYALPNSGSGGGGYLSIESATALAWSLLAAVGRLQGQWHTDDEAGAR